MKFKITCALLMVAFFGLAQTPVKTITVVKDGLVAWYPFNGNCNDESNNMNNGNAFGPTLVKDRFGEANSAYQFNGVSDYLDIGHILQLKNKMSVSISLWVKMDKPNGTKRAMIAKWEDPNQPPNIFILDNGSAAAPNKGGFGVELLDLSHARVDGKTPLITGEWMHIAATYDGENGVISIYKNGKLDNSVTDPNWKGKTLKYHTNYTGKVGQGEGNYAGSIDDIRIYNRALTEAEIWQIFKNEKVIETIEISGQLTNVKNKQPIAGEIKFRGENNEFEPIVAKCDANGKYKAILPIENKYIIDITADKFIPGTDLLDANGLKKNTKQEKNFSLKAMFIGEAVRINNIFFETGSAVLKPQSYPELDKLIDIINDYKELSVLIAGHTDNVGSEESNQKLSQARAESVKAYFVSKGVKNDIITQGYGSTKPVAANDTEAGKEQNRRVEFTILEKKEIVR